MMRIYSRACEALSLDGASILPLTTCKDAVVGVVVAHIYSVTLTEFLKGSLGRTYIVTVLIRHEMHIAKI